jgi:hypothetical protein
MMERVVFVGVEVRKKRRKKVRRFVRWTRSRQQHRRENELEELSIAMLLLLYHRLYVLSIPLDDDHINHHEGLLYLSTRMQKRGFEESLLYHS